MSATTGRMSRQDAQSILQAIPPVLREFSTPDATPELLQEVAALAAWHGFLQDTLDRGRPHSAAEIRDLRSRVAALQADRLLRSSAIQPYTVRASVVFLPGIPDSDHAIGQAAHLAASDLGLRSDQVRLQDCSNVRTATFTGTRYIFLPRDLPHTAQAL